MVIPGIGGSVLETTDGAPVWGQGRRALAGALAHPAQLSLAEHPILRPVALLPSTRVHSWKVVVGYNHLVEQVRNTFNLRDDDVDMARDDAVRKPGASLLLFPYDFRLGVPAAAGRVAAEVTRRLADLTEDARLQRVIIVAHSMGGLIARYWLGPLKGGPVCKALITLGTPHRGAPKAMDWLLNGVHVGPGPARSMTSWLFVRRDRCVKGMAVDLPPVAALPSRAGR